MINRHLAHLWCEMKIHRILTQVYLLQIGCLCLLLLRKNQFFSSPKTSQQSVYGNPIAPSFYSILLDNIYGRQAAKFYMKMVSFFVGNPAYTDKLGFQEFTRLFSNSSFQIQFLNHQFCSSIATKMKRSFSVCINRFRNCKKQKFSWQNCLTSTSNKHK